MSGIARVRAVKIGLQHWRLLFSSDMFRLLLWLPVRFNRLLRLSNVCTIVIFFPLITIYLLPVHIPVRILCHFGILLRRARRPCVLSLLFRRVSISSRQNVLTLDSSRAFLRACSPVLLHLMCTLRLSSHGDLRILPRLCVSIHAANVRRESCRDCVIVAYNRTCSPRVSHLSSTPRVSMPLCPLGSTRLCASRLALSVSRASHRTSVPCGSPRL